MALLTVDDLKVHFRTARGRIRAVDGLSFDVKRGEILAIVGESGSGKSITALALMRLLPAAKLDVAGTAHLNGTDLLGIPEAEMRAIRGKRMGMVFQEPMTSLNPVLTIGRQVREVLLLHKGMSKSDATAAAIELLSKVGIPAAAKRLGDYPHQLSGGMRQRVMIAIALACSPELLIADEPTTALDVTIQAQILDLIRNLTAETGSAVMLITHDLGVVAENAERVVVMYAGRKVEEADVDTFFRHACHPYSLGLLRAIPQVGSSARVAGRSALFEIPGSVQSAQDVVSGCSFAPRCSAATDICRTVAPAIRDMGGGHLVSCHHV